MEKNNTNTINIDERRIEALLKPASPPSASGVERLLAGAMELKGLGSADAAELLNITDPALLQRLFGTARSIKNLIYGRRLVIFAPLYVSNYCLNNCLYCGFRKDNRGIARKCLTLKEMEEETLAILEQGHKRALMLMGDDEAGCSFGHFLDCIRAAYGARDGKGSSLRRINVEVPPQPRSNLLELARAHIGTYTVFQETYHRKTYEALHPSGPKGNYINRLSAMDGALSCGLGDVGIGALLGLYDYRFEVLALIEHAGYLERKYGAGPHTISVPRVEPASGAPLSVSPPSPVTDLEFKKIVAVLRCAVPYAGIILSTRESASLRDELFGLGVSQISAGSRTEPGGYPAAGGGGQFSLNDTRSTGDVIASVVKQGYIPSFCTGCYRLGRVGGDFMELAKPGLIQKHCLPNALLTFREYLLDYASVETLKAGERLIGEQLEGISDPSAREKASVLLGRVDAGERDIYI